MNTSSESNRQSLDLLLQELNRKKRQLELMEEEFATEKLEILKEIAKAKRGDSAASSKAPQVAVVDDKKLRDLQNQKTQLTKRIQEKKDESGKLQSLLDTRSEELEKLVASKHAKTQALPAEDDYDLLRKEISGFKHDLNSLKPEKDRIMRRIAKLEDQAESISLGAALRTQFETGNFNESLPTEIVDFCKEKQQEARDFWLDARNSYPNVNKYLQNGILAFFSSVDMYYAAISAEIPKDARNVDDFRERVQVLSKANIKIRASLAESLIGMIVKMERGIDVAPQPSFLKEIWAFLREMADAFQLEGVK
ncbi:MAG: hypothetical protein ACXAEI_17910 [Candidatus Hodarchaeales archaeon]|jgi:hypothetical protein